MREVGMHDIVIRGGTTMDGTGKAAFSGNVAIAESRISALGGTGHRRVRHEQRLRRRGL
jgi:N-acyl-D-amino-acid deacylase